MSANNTVTRSVVLLSADGAISSEISGVGGPLAWSGNSLIVLGTDLISTIDSTNQVTTTSIPGMVLLSPPTAAPTALFASSGAIYVPILDTQTFLPKIMKLIPSAGTYGLDGTFGSNGTATIAAQAAATHLALDGAGSLDVALSGQAHEQVARLLPDGTLDATWGTSGLLATAQSGGPLVIEALSSTLIAGGQTGAEGVISAYTNTGTIDTSFGYLGSMNGIGATDLALDDANHWLYAVSGVVCRLRLQ